MAISVTAWRALMGADAEGLSDAQVQQDQDEFRNAARVLFAVFDERQRGARDPKGPMSATAPGSVAAAAPRKGRSARRAADGHEPARHVLDEAAR
jgi:hypothetical protein